MISLLVTFLTFRGVFSYVQSVQLHRGPHCCKFTRLSRGAPACDSRAFLKVREMIHTDTDTLYFAILLSTDTDSLYFNLHFIFTFLGALPWFTGFWVPLWWPAYFLGILRLIDFLGAPFTIHNISEPLSRLATFPGPFHDPQHFRAPFITLRYLRVYRNL